MRDAQAFAARAVAGVLDGHTLDRAFARDRSSAHPLDDRERALARELGYGTLRHLGRLRGILAPLLSRPPSDRALEALLCVALYQLRHGHASAHAVVTNAVDAAQRLRLTSAKGLVNAVLRKYLRERDAIDAGEPASDEARWSYPQWWIDRVRADWPGQWQAILEAGNERPPLTLRANRRRTTRDAAARSFADAGIACRPIGEDGIVVADPRDVHALPGFDQGLLSVQDHGAQLAATLLDARDGMRVLDACAAPGGKTTHILERADCELVALELDEARLQRVRENLQRLDLTATTIAADAADPASWWDGRPFDRVLADVPCSASGVVRRHPDGKWLRRPTDIAQFAAQQRRILDAAWTVLAPGGRLLYTTCSLFHEENGAQVDGFLARHADARRLGIAAPDGVTMESGGQILPVRRETGDGEENHDGFFHALIAKER